MDSSRSTLFYACALLLLLACVAESYEYNSYKDKYAKPYYHYPQYPYYPKNTYHYYPKNPPYYNKPPYSKPKPTYGYDKPYYPWSIIPYPSNNPNKQVEVGLLSLYMNNKVPN